GLHILAQVVERLAFDRIGDERYPKALLVHLDDVLDTRLVGRRVAVVGNLDLRQALAVRESGIGEQLLGLLRVVVPALLVLVVSRIAWWDPGQGLGAGILEPIADIRVAVEAGREGLAHLLVI